MNKDLSFSASVFGFGAGIFFIGYFLFEVPSNVVLEKVGARLSIARVIITWGTAAATGIATINSIGNPGGWVKDAAGSFTGGLYVVAGLLVFSAAPTLVLAGTQRASAAATQPANA